MARSVGIERERVVAVAAERAAAAASIVAADRDRGS